MDETQEEALRLAREKQASHPDNDKPFLFRSRDFSYTGIVYAVFKYDPLKDCLLGDTTLN